MDSSAPEALFTSPDGKYHFARWGRPIAPVVFGVEEETLRTVKGAIEAVTGLAGHTVAETDPELGANLMLFFFREWRELSDVPNLDRLIPGLHDLVERLEEVGANQYRVFRFDEAGAIRACFAFLRIDEDLAALPAEVIALDQAVRMILNWSDRAFAARSPLAEAGGRLMLRPEIAAVIRAAYDPVMPASAMDPSHALRLAARMSLPGPGAQ
ncbi:hypothetical protein [Ostreiculturibacter nitratireducens]|uniref:hypothetical protein n=1 Tax=Ostreiculturibacter nitratireducens TaxID=3075226 RepID=UPI0031B6042C